jgi:nitroreductase
MVERPAQAARVETVDAVIKQRRTHKIWAGKPVDRATLEALIELAIWAPNHRYTEPWRFAVVAHDRLPRLRDAVLAELDRRVDALGEGEDDQRMARKLASKRKKQQQRFGEVGAVIGVVQREADDTFVRREDYAATACAIQNMLLGAEARGLGALWSTGDLFLCDTLRPFWGLGQAEVLVGVVFLGHPDSAPVPVRHKTPESVTTWL